MRRWPTVGLGLALLWPFVRDVSAEPSAVLGELLIGLAVGMPIAFVFRGFYTETVPAGEIVRSVPWIAVYAGLFLRELLTANVDVARRVLAPSMPIEPRVIEIPLRVETDLAVTTIANSISLTPGTLTMDYDDDRNSLYVHAIAGADRESIVAPIRRWEDYALRIFDEDLGPDAPVPRRPRDDAFDGGENGGD